MEQKEYRLFFILIGVIIGAILMSIFMERIIDKSLSWIVNELVNSSPERFNDIMGKVELVRKLCRI